MVGHDQRNAPVVVLPPAHPADRRVGLQKLVRRDAPDDEDQPGRDVLYLRVEIAPALIHFLPVRVAVVGRPALQDVGDEHGAPRLADRASSERYRDLVREEARRGVADFVRKWLLSQEFWTDDRFSTVKVIFPDEVTAHEVEGPTAPVVLRSGEVEPPPPRP